MSNPPSFITFFVLLAAFFVSTAHASEKVTIRTGEVVILADDGTWNYENRPVQRNRVIKTDRSGYRETNNCDYSPGRNIGGYNLWIDPSRWDRGNPRGHPPGRPANR